MCVIIKIYFSVNSPTILVKTCNDHLPAALKNLQVLDKEALEKPQILDTRRRSTQETADTGHRSNPWLRCD